MNAEQFVAALRRLLLVEHMTMYRNQLAAAQNPVVIEGLDLGDESESEMFLASLDELQQTRYLNQVHAVISATATSILAVLDAENPLGKKPVEFSLVPKGGADIAGELSDLFEEAEIAARSSDATTTGADGPAHPADNDDIPGEEDEEDGQSAPMEAEEFIDRVREVLFEVVLPLHTQMVEDIARHRDDKTAPGWGGREFTFLAGLDDGQRAAYLTGVRAVINDTGANILGILDGETATRNDYLEFAVVPPGGEDISGDLQELFLMADEDGPFRADPAAGGHERGSA